MGRWQWTACVSGVALVYYSAARLGLLLQLPETNVSPVWPPSGIGLAAALLLGLRVWPGIMLGAFLANLLTLPFTPAGFLASSAIGLGNTLEHVVAFVLIRRLVPSPHPFHRPRDVFWFMLTAGLSCAVASTNGATSLWLLGIIPGTAYRPVWFTWWLGDTAGMLVLTPAIYCWCRAPRLRLSLVRMLELVALVVLTAVTAEFLFGGWLASEVIASLPYLVVPCLLWAAFRFGQRETASLAVLLSVIAVGHTWSWLGMAETSASPQSVFAPFLGPAITANQSLLMLQLFICAVAATAVTLAAAVAERTQVERERAQAGAEIRRLNAELERRVKERTAELQAANRELEAFSYSVSHDLRAPLRAIDGFSRILLEKHSVHLLAEGKDYLKRVRDNTREMGRVIDDLLAFSRLSRQPIKKQPVEPDKIVQQCLEELRGEQQGRRLEIAVANLSPCQAEPFFLKQVWINLLSNALKYTRQREQAKIEVGCRNGDPADGPVYFIRDNGVGFDPRYAHKLFGVFQRLHRAEDYEGSGVGLAIVQNIIHRHGGKVWADARPDQGATFYFTLGKGPDEERGVRPI